MRPKGGAALWRGDSTDQTEAIIDHMSRAAAPVGAVTPWKDADAALNKALSLRMQATLAVPEDGKILDTNLSAEVVFDFLPGGTVKDLPIDAEDAQRLLGHLRRMAGYPGAVNGPNDVLTLRNDQTGPPIVILRTSDVGWPQHLGPILNDLFALSPAEVEVIRLLVEGCKMKEIAQRRVASPTTVRSLLQSIFAKTGTRDQMDCVRMVFGLALMHDADEGRVLSERIEGAQGTPYDPREHQR